MTDEFSKVGEFSSPGVPTPESHSSGQPGESENGIDVDAIAGSLTAAPLGGEDVRLISTTWESVRLEFEISVSGSGPRKQDLTLTIGGTTVPIEEVSGPRGSLRIAAEFSPSELSGIGSPQPVRVKVEDDRGATGSTRVGTVRVISPSTSGRSRPSASSSASSLSTTDENAIFGLTRAQAAVGAAGVGIAGAVLAALL